MYLLRLDDAAEFMNLPNWIRMEQLCDTYCVRPVVGIIPKCEDENLWAFGFVADFWEIVARYQKK